MRKVQFEERESARVRVRLHLSIVVRSRLLLVVVGFENFVCTYHIKYAVCTCAFVRLCGCIARIEYVRRGRLSGPTDIGSSVFNSRHNAIQLIT